MPSGNQQQSFTTATEAHQNTLVMKEQVQNALSFLRSQIAPEENFNFQPIFHTQINQHDGIKITGKFKTNDSSDEGRMSFITVNRSGNLAIPWDGFGIAWRKGTGGGSGKYNVYMIDNDAQSEFTYIHQDQLVDNTGGVNQFIMAAKKEILVDTWYTFQIVIYSHLGMDVWIEPTSSWVENPTKDTVLMTRGQTYPPYQRQSSGEHFGISVYNTSNSEWFYDDIRIVSIVQNYPMHLFKLKADGANFKTGQPASIKYFGSGYGEAVGRTRLYARTFDQANNEVGWELLGSNTVSAAAADFQPSGNYTKIEKSVANIDTYRDGNEYAWILATPWNYEDGEHFLRSYYVGLENITSSGVHIGGKADIYLHDPDNMAIGTISGTATNGLQILGDLTVSLDQVAGINLPILDIIGVTNSEFSDISYTEGVDYTVNRTTKGQEFSTKDPIYLTFNSNLQGVTVSISYRYSLTVPNVQSTMDSDEYRAVATSNLVKNCPLHIVNIIGLTYEGPMSESELDDILIKYITKTITDNKLDKSDIIAQCTNAGATFVNTSFTIQVKSYDFAGAWKLTNVTETYSITDGLGVFHADTTSISGTVKQNVA